MCIIKLVDISYKSDKEFILKNINLDIKKGECISIVGSSGSGKSTLLKLFSDLIAPTSGTIYFKGEDYKKYNPMDLRKKVSYILQSPYLFGQDVFDNLYYPFYIRDEPIDLDRVKYLLSQMNLNDTYLTKKIEDLSGGEKQRISIIRNLLYKPDVLLLDEATSALDSENTMCVESMIKKLNDEGVTILWITHDTDQSSRIFNRRIEIKDGEILSIEEI